MYQCYVWYTIGPFFPKCYNKKISRCKNIEFFIDTVYPPRFRFYNFWLFWIVYFSSAGSSPLDGVLSSGALKVEKDSGIFFIVVKWNSNF